MDAILNSLPQIGTLAHKVLSAQSEWDYETDPIVKAARAVILQEQLRKVRQAILSLYELSVKR